MNITDWSEKLYQWREYAKALYPLRAEVSDILATEYIWGTHGNCEERHYEADDDTFFLLKLAEKLNDVCDFVKSHIGILEHRVSIEEDIHANLEQAFEAWKRGLCPVLMKSVPRYVKPYSMNFWENYDEIAKFLHSVSGSYHGRS